MQKGERGVESTEEGEIEALRPKRTRERVTNAIMNGAQSSDNVQQIGTIPTLLMMG